MLRIHLGESGKELKAPDMYFNLNYEDVWFEDDLVKQMILDVDKTTVYSAMNMENTVYGATNCRSLSSGVKTLILAYKTDLLLDASFCGDNCAKWLVEIGRRKDVLVNLYHMMIFSDTETFEIEIVNSGVVVHNFDEFVDEYFHVVFAS